MTARCGCSIEAGTDHLQDAETSDDLAIVPGVAGGLPLERATAGLAEATSALVAAIGPLVILVFFRVWAGALIAIGWFTVRTVVGRETRCASPRGVET